MAGGVTEKVVGSVAGQQNEIWWRQLWEAVKKWKIFNLTGEEASTVVTYFAVFFAFGFIFRKYISFAIKATIFAIILLKILEHYGYVDLDYVSIKGAVGIQEGEDIWSVLQRYMDYVNSHRLIVFSSLLGFLIGYKLS